MMGGPKAPTGAFDSETIGAALRSVLPPVCPAVAAYAPDASADERLQGLIERLRRHPGALVNGAAK